MLPLWNPYLFSGTPLLAGSTPPPPTRPPGSWRCCPSSSPGPSILPLAYDVALAGMYLFLRRQGLCRAAAATFGAATFAFAGYMTAQIVHIDLIQGAAAGCPGCSWPCMC